MLLLKPTIQLNGKKYKIISQIGEGAFGYVYHAKSIAKETKYEDYAIKKMICQTPEQSAEARKEIDIMVKVKHNNVLPLVDFAYSFNKNRQEEVLLLLPLYKTSVQHLIDQGAGYPYCAFHDGLDLVRVLRHCIDGLCAVHQAGFRHADLKPANILLTQDYHAVLTDFGSCMPIPITVTNRSEALEVQETAAKFTTASYRAPELFDTPSSIIIDGKSDIWSFGCLMYCLMYSKTPFESLTEGLSTLSILTAQFQYPTDNIWPADYVELINKCIVADPAKRIDINEVQISLKRLSGPPLDLKIPEKVVKTDKLTPSEKESSFKTLSFLSSSHKPPVATKSGMEGIGSTSFKSNDGAESAGPLEFADFNSHLSSDDNNATETLSPTEWVEVTTDHKQGGFDDSFDPFRTSHDGKPISAFDDIIVASKNPPTEDDDFGDFSSARQASGSSSQQAKELQKALKNDSHQSKVKSSDVAGLEEEVIDLHHVILNDIATKKVLKEGTVYSMRMGGFPKRLQKKSNWLILTPAGLVLRKDKQISSKIHEILTFHRPLSITPSDTLAVGMNGLIISGWKPLPLFSGDHHDDSENEHDKESHEQREAQLDNDHKVWYNLKYKKSPLDGKDASNKEFKTKALSGINMEISFQDHDEMNEWIDQIMIQYEQCVENILLQRL